jgi:hypothetical protein
MTPKTPTQRVAELRPRRAEQGLTRLDVYAHPDDHAAIKALAEDAWTAEAARWIRQRYPDGVPEDQIAPLAEQLRRGVEEQPPARVAGGLHVVR